MANDKTQYRNQRDGLNYQSEREQEALYRDKYSKTLKKIHDEKGPYAAAAFQIKYNLNALGKQIGSLFMGLAPKEEEKAEENIGNNIKSYRRDQRAKNLMEHRTQRQDSLLRHKYSRLERTAATETILCLLLSIIFLSVNITGNIIIDSDIYLRNIFGVIFFFLGLAGTFYLFNVRRQ